MMDTNTETKVSNLWEKHNYLNKDIDIILDKEIIEYDMREAGFNLIIKYKLLPEHVINRLHKMSKEQRKIVIGKMERKDRELMKAKNDAFKEARRLFFEANQLTDDDVLSIKKDAIFTYKRCYNIQFDNVLFVEKNVYSSYIYLNRTELYYNNGTIDVKGIGDEFVALHQDYMLSFFSTVFNLLETHSSKKMIEFLKDFIEMYKGRELPIEFYRELNKTSMYRYVGDLNVLMNEVGDVSLIDIRYNLLNYICPLLNILI